jgi:hypothetical protein
MNILNIILMDFTLEMLPSTAYLSQQDKIALAVPGYDRVNKEFFSISDKTGNVL